MAKKIKILFILPSLKPGGAERVVSYLSQHINKDIFKPYLLILYRPTDRDYVIDKDVSIWFMRKNRSLTAIPSIIYKIIKLRPDIVFTSIGQLNLLGGILSLFFRRVKFIAREASVFSTINLFTDKKRLSINVFKSFFYNRLQKIICQSNDMAKDLCSTFHLKEDKVMVIGNPVTIVTSQKSIQEDTSVTQLITVGRLSKEKGIERLLKILTQLDFRFHYTLIGDGKERGALLKIIHELGLEDRVTHIPYTNEVSKYLAISDLFLQGSYVEGFPNALAESCASGVPVIAFNAPGGTRDIIEDGINGFMVSDSDEFLEKLTFSLFRHQWTPSKIKSSVSEKFSPDIILSKYERLFRSVV